MKPIKKIGMAVLAMALCSAIFAADSQQAKPEPLYLLTLRFKKSSFTLDIWQHSTLDYRLATTQANLCADYHAAVEKALLKWMSCNHECFSEKAFSELDTALSELSAVHEKAKWLL